MVLVITITWDIEGLNELSIADKSGPFISPAAEHACLEVTTKQMPLLC
jgi:hypothetical protein